MGWARAETSVLSANVGHKSSGWMWNYASFAESPSMYLQASILGALAGHSLNQTQKSLILHTPEGARGPFSLESIIDLIPILHECDTAQLSITVFVHKAIGFYSTLEYSILASGWSHSLNPDWLLDLVWI